MHFLLNSVVVIMVLILVVLGLIAVDMLVEPAAQLQAFFGVWCLPPPRAVAFVFLGVSLVVAILEAVAAKATAG